MATAAIGLGACDRPGPPDRPPDLAGLRDAAITDGAAAKARALPHPTIAADSALRCEECHAAITTQWRGSAHARATASPVYAAMRARAPEGAACDRCHAPLAALVEPRSRAGGEAVTCDVCHRIRAVDLVEDGARFAIEPHGSVKYGPLCDAEDNYFHRAGCSPLHEDAQLCAACHSLRLALPSGEALPVYTDFDEWRTSPAAARNHPCQRCHMPSRRGEAARGSRIRPHVPHHGMLAADGQLRRRAVDVQARIRERAGERAVVEVTLTNKRAGHHVPAGGPERRFVLRVRSLDAAGGEAGGEIDRKEVRYGRKLVDAAGNEAPFYEAARVDADTRLAPGERRVEAIDVAAPVGCAIEVSLLFEPASEATAKRVGVAAPATEVLSSLRIGHGAGKRRRSR